VIDIEKIVEIEIGDVKQNKTNNNKIKITNSTFFIFITTTL